AAEGWGDSRPEGVLTRPVRDSAAILDVISGRMPGEPYYAPALPRPLADEVGVDPGRLRVGVLEGPPGDELLDDPECRVAVAAAARLLERLGHEVEESYPAEMFNLDIARAFTAIISADSESTFLA